MIKDNKFLAVGIAGSPRRKGNSSALLRAYLEGTSVEGFETEYIYLNGLSYKGCQACDQCVKGKACQVKDDLNSVFPILQRAQIWAMASPIYYDGVSGQLKTFFDRLRFTTYDPCKLKGPRRAILLVTYADKKREDYLKTASSLAKFLTWNNRGDFGNIRVEAGPNMDSINAWKKHPELIEKLKKTGIQQAKEIKELSQ